LFLTEAADGRVCRSRQVACICGAMTKRESRSPQGSEARATARAAGELATGRGGGSLADQREQSPGCGKPRPPSMLKALLSRGREGHESPRQDALVHDGNNASIVLDEETQRETPWTPKSLGRAKTAIIYKVSSMRS
jgi:hypothetical protein